MYKIAQLPRSLIKVADFVMIVALIACVQAVIEKIILRDDHKPSYFQEDLIESLEAFNPFELGGIFLYSMFQGGSPEIANTLEFRSCMRRGSHAELPEEIIELLNGVNEKTETSALIAEHPELKGISSASIECYRAAQRAWNSLKSLSLPGQIRLLDGFRRTVVFIFQRDNAAFRLIVFCQLLVGACAYSIFWFRFVDRKKDDIGSFLMSMPIGAIVLGTALAFPLSWIALITLKFVTATYLATGFKLIEKIVDYALHSLAHVAVNALHRH